MVPDSIEPAELTSEDLLTLDNRYFTPDNAAICALCGSDDEDSEYGRDFDVHRIVPVISGGINHEDLLLVLCPSCHKKADWYTRQFVDPVLADSD